MKGTRPQAIKTHLRVEPAFARKVRPSSLRRAVQAAFESAGEERRGELTLVVADDAQVRTLNRVYRDVDATTDVLAFGDAGEPDVFIPSPEATIYFGDIVVCYPRAVEQAAAYGHPVEDELSLLVVHGTLHLLGYDHERGSDREEMWRIQSAALARLDIDWRP